MCRQRKVTAMVVDDFEWISRVRYRWSRKGSLPQCCRLGLYYRSLMSSLF